MDHARYKKLEAEAGETLESCIKRLCKYEEKGIKCYLVFNGHELYSDMTPDEMRKIVMSDRQKTNSEESQDDFYKEEALTLIFEYMSIGRKYISKDLIKDWDELVIDSVYSKYKGIDIRYILEIIELLSMNEEFVFIENKLESQAHFNNSKSKVLKSVYKFHPKGKDFVEHIDSKNKIYSYNVENLNGKVLKLKITDFGTGIREILGIDIEDGKQYVLSYDFIQ